MMLMTNPIKIQIQIRYLKTCHKAQRLQRSLLLAAQTILHRKKLYNFTLSRTTWMQKSITDSLVSLTIKRSSIHTLLRTNRAFKKVRLNKTEINLIQHITTRECSKVRSELSIPSNTRRYSKENKT